MSDLIKRLWNKGFFPPPGEPWTTEDHERVRELQAEIDRLRAERNRWQHTADTQDDLLNQQAQRIASLEGALGDIQNRADEKYSSCSIGRGMKAAWEDAGYIADEALAKEQDDPDHEPENPMCACPTCIAKGWEDQV